MMHAVLLNLIQTGEIRSYTYGNRWFDFERTARSTGYFETRWSNVSIIRFESGSTITFGGKS